MAEALVPLERSISCYSATSLANAPSDSRATPPVAITSMSAAIASMPAAVVSGVASVNTMYGVDADFVKNFAFRAGHTRLSTYTEVITIIALYFLGVFALKQFVAQRGKPYDLTRFAVAYNAALSAMSAALLYAHCSEVVALLQSHGFWSVFCDERVEHTRGSHVFIYYVSAEHDTAHSLYP